MKENLNFQLIARESMVLKLLPMIYGICVIILNAEHVEEWKMLLQKVGRTILHIINTDKSEKWIVNENKNKLYENKR